MSVGIVGTLVTLFDPRGCKKHEKRRARTGACITLKTNWRLAFTNLKVSTINCRPFTVVLPEAKKIRRRLSSRRFGDPLTISSFRSWKPAIFGTRCPRATHPIACPACFATRMSPIFIVLRTLAFGTQRPRVGPATRPMPRCSLLSKMKPFRGREACVAPHIPIIATAAPRIERASQRHGEYNLIYAHIQSLRVLYNRHFLGIYGRAKHAAKHHSIDAAVVASHLDRPERHDRFWRQSLPEPAFSLRPTI